MILRCCTQRVERTRKRLSRRLCGSLAAALLCLDAGGALAEPVIGQVKRAEGNAFIISNGVSTPAEIGSFVRAKDTLITGSSGSLGVTLRDDTRLSLGPTSAMLMKEFEFDLMADKHRFVGEMTKGSLLYESHWEGKYAAVETPNATIGIRGTRFLLRVHND